MLFSKQPQPISYHLSLIGWSLTGGSPVSHVKSGYQSDHDLIKI